MINVSPIGNIHPIHGTMQLINTESGKTVDSVKNRHLIFIPDTTILPYHHSAEEQIVTKVST